MKTAIGINLFTVVVLFTLAHASNASSIAADGRDLRTAIANDDQQAFERASKLAVDEAAPLLLVYVDDASTNPARAEHAREALRKMPGFPDYMKRRLLAKRAQPGGEYQMEEFRQLQAIGGEVAAAAVAPFLFVDDSPLLVASDHSAGPIKFDALNALIEMHLEDAPKGSIDEWKKWAENKGYRDTKIPTIMTLEEKGVPPDVIARSKAFLEGAKNASLAPAAATQNQIPTPGSPHLPQAVTRAASPQSATPVIRDPVTAIERRPPVWLWTTGTLALVAIIAVALKFSRSKS